MAGENAWFSLSECCRAFDVTRQTFDTTYRPLIPANDIKNAGKRGVSIRLRGLIDALVAKRAAEAEPRQAEDPLLVGAGGDSPNLERYRAAKAGLTELDLELRKETHADIRELDTVFMQFAGILRRAIEAQQRRWGNECSDIMNEALDEALRQLRDSLPPPP